MRFGFKKIGFCLFKPFLVVLAQYSFVFVKKKVPAIFKFKNFNDLKPKFELFETF